MHRTQVKLQVGSRCSGGLGLVVESTSGRLFTPQLFAARPHTVHSIHSHSFWSRKDLAFPTTLSLAPVELWELGGGWAGPSGP